MCRCWGVIVAAAAEASPAAQSESALGLVEGQQQCGNDDHEQCHRHEDFEHPGVPEGHPLRPHVLCLLSRERWLAGGAGGAGAAGDAGGADADAADAAAAQPAVPSPAAGGSASSR